MAEWTKRDYELYSTLPESELTDEERKLKRNFERAEAKAPSLDDLDWANEVVKAASSSTLNFLYSPILTSIHDCWKNHSLDKPY